MAKATDKTDQQNLKTFSLGDLLNHDFPTRDHLIAPWLRQGESAMIYAAPGVGKSMLAMSLALAVAGGGELLDWKVETPRNVLFVDGEMYIDDLQARANLLIPTVEGTDAKLADTNLTILARQAQDPDTEFPDLSEPEGRNQLFRYARKGINGSGPFDLVILDNLTTLATKIQDENSAAEFNEIIKLLLKLKQAGVACMLIHHSNKSGGAYRGSSKLATTFEVILRLQALDGVESRRGAAFTTQWDKYRLKRDTSTISRDMCLEKDDFDQTVWSAAVSESEEAMTLVSEVRTCSHTTQAQIADKLGWSTAKVSRLKTKAIRQDLISEHEWRMCLKEAGENDWSGGFDGGEDEGDF